MPPPPKAQEKFQISLDCSILRYFRNALDPSSLLVRSTPLMHAAAGPLQSERLEPPECDSEIKLIQQFLN